MEQLRKTRDAVAVESVLDEITEAAKTGNKNLLELAVKAAELRATVGEISMAIEKVSVDTSPQIQLSEVHILKSPSKILMIKV